MMDQALIVGAVIALWKMIEFLIRKLVDKNSAAMGGFSGADRVKLDAVYKELTHELPNGSVRAMTDDIYKVVTAQDPESGANKVWSPAKPIDELAKKIDDLINSIDLKQLERTHTNTNAQAKLMSDVVEELKKIRGHLEQAHGGPF